MPPVPDPLSQRLADWPQPPGARAPCGLVLVTADSRVQSANVTAQAWFGETAGAQRHWAEYLGVDDDDPRRVVLRTFTDAMRSDGSAAPAEVELMRCDGSVFMAEISGQALIDPVGVYLGFDALVLDVTQRRRTERAVSAALNRELQQRVADRSRRLAAANRDLEVFSHLISHDLRAPLRHLQGYLGLVRDRVGEQGDAVLLEYQRAMQQSTQRMRQMLECLLEYARLGRVPLQVQVQVQVQAVALSPLLRGVLTHLLPQANGAAIEWRIDADLPVVRGDPMLLAQAFTHLLANAIKFTRGVAHPAIAVGWHISDERVRTFHVSDNGVGFDRTQARNLFVMFQRQHHSMDFEGLGAGLALTQRIVERHGGRIWCEAAPGQGCSVRFSLPFDGVVDGVNTP